MLTYALLIIQAAGTIYTLLRLTAVESASLLAARQGPSRLRGVAPGARSPRAQARPEPAAPERPSSEGRSEEEDGLASELLKARGFDLSRRGRSGEERP